MKEKETIEQLRMRVESLQQIADKVIPIEERLRTIEEKAFFVKDVLTLKEAAVYIGASLSQIYKMTSSGCIPHYKPRGKMCYFEKKELDAWLLQNHFGPVMNCLNNG